MPRYAYEETLAVFGDRPGVRDSLLSSYERITSLITAHAVTALPPREEWLRLRTHLLFSRTPSSVTRPEVVLDFSPEDQLWAEWIAAVLASAGVAVPWVGDRPVDPPGEFTGPAQVVMVMSESRARRMADIRPAVLPHLLISVDEYRIPSTSQLGEVPVIFLTGLSEPEAVDALVGRLGGQLPVEPESPNADLRYPGADRRQVLSIPARNANFTGRDDDLGELREVLRSRGMTVVLPVTIQGLGGIGKTQLAMEYAHRFKADYDVVWWLNCSQSQYIDASLIDLGSRLRREFGASIPEEGGASFEIAQQVLQYLGSDAAPHRWLLVYDNADTDIDYIQELLPTGRGHVLITSRATSWGDQGGKTLKVDFFKPEESIDHLRRRIPGIPEADARQVADVLDNMPLAVAAAGALLAELRIPVPEYLRQLDLRPELDLSPGHPLGDYPPSVAKAWSLSLDYLQRRSPASARLLTICSAMSSEISLDLILSQAMIDAVRGLDPTLTERSMIWRLIRQVDLLALIKLDNDNHQIQVHRVVQVVVNERLSTQEQGDARRDVHKLLVAARPEGDVDDPLMWPRYRLMWPHLTPSQAIWSTDRQVQDLLVDRVRYIRARDDLERGVRRATEIERAWRTMLGEGQQSGQDESLRAHLFRLRFNLANILREQGKFQDSRAINEEVLRDQEELLGAEHPHTLQTRSSLAADLRALGEYRAALELDKGTFRSWAERSGFGDQYPATLMAANNLALSYLLNGDVREALQRDLRTLERRTAVQGDKHPRTLNSGAAVARDLLEAGRYRDAVTRLEQVWAACRETLGHNDRTTLNARLWLGVALRCTGQPDLAAPHINTACDELMRGFGRDSNDALSARLSQAINLLALQRPGEARTKAEELLAIYEGRVGPRHPHSLICRLDISAALYAHEEYGAALAQAQQAAGGLGDQLGHEHPYTLSAAVMLASLLARHDLNRASELEEYAATERARILGERHPDTLRARANHLLTRHEMGDAAASGERQAVINELARLLGENHPDVTAAISARRLLCVVDPQPF